MRNDFPPFPPRPESKRAGHRRLTRPLGSPVTQAFQHRFKTTTGLTQVELLVVIIIIGFLSALTFPVINAARSSAQAATCLNHLKQTGGALLRFATDHRGRLLPSRLSDEVRNLEPNPKPSAYWNRRLQNEGYLPQQTAEGAPLNPSLFCPSLLPNGHPSEPNETYGMRDWRGARAPNGNYLPLTNLPHPARFFLLADSISISSRTQWYAIQSEGGSNGVHLRHRGKANTFFADGHIAPTEAEYFKSLGDNEPEFTRRSFNVLDTHGNLQ